MRFCLLELATVFLDTLNLLGIDNIDLPKKTMSWSFLRQKLKKTELELHKQTREKAGPSVDQLQVSCIVLTIYIDGIPDIL